MSYSALVVKVLIASPSDVSTDRQLIRDIIHEWNAAHSEGAGIVLMPIGWESNATPQMGDRPQAIINSQLTDQCDLLIALFWTRLGTPTGEHESGTVEEVERYLKAGKPAMLYFSSAPIRPDRIDRAQHEKLDAFKVSCKQRGLVHDYGSTEELRSSFSRHLAQSMRRHAASAPATSQTTEIKTDGLSLEGRILLLEASKDKHGTVLITKTFGGDFVQTNGHNLLREQSAREAARWDSAVADLRRRGLLKSTSPDGQVLTITEAGYQAADRLPSMV